MTNSNDVWLNQIKPDLVRRLSSKLAKSSGVQRSIEEQLTLFIDAVQIAIETGEPSWIDPIIEEWSSQHTEADSVQVTSNLQSFFNEITIVTAQFISESKPYLLSDFIDSVLPIFLYAQQKIFIHILNKTQESQAQKSADIQMMLDRLDKSKSNFIAIAAHELKTPLTLIEGYTTMLDEAVRSEPDNTLPLNYLNGIKRGTSRLRQIIQDMIDVSLIDSRLMLLNFQPCFINQLIEAVVNDVSQRISERDLQIQWQRIEEVRNPIYLDEIRISQAVKNVIENAVKFTPDGGLIAISGRKLPGFIEIIITDNGIGIDPEDQLIIFEKFSQLGDASLHSTSKSKFKGGGAGLGLPIAKGILEAHGGAIWVESPGYNEITCPGSTFHLMIPEYVEPPKIQKSYNSVTQNFSRNP